MSMIPGPSAERGWPSLSVLADGRDRRFWQRMGIAFAIALALHEVIAGLVPRRAPDKKEEPVVSQIVTLITRTPAPTPTPVPPPTARPSVEPVVTFAPVATRAQAAPRAVAPVRKTLGGLAAKRHVTVVPPHSIHATPRAVAFATAAGSGVQNGGSGSGAGPGVNGNGGLAGTGSGLGGTGNGSGGGVRPCGVVMLVPIGNMLQQYRDGSRTVGIQLEVTLSDGQTVTDVLGWKFYYRREVDDPFSKRGQDANTPPTLQLPPPGYDLEGRQKPATVFAVRHTNAKGFTDLEDCPP
jgi:hypothetical protein